MVKINDRELLMTFLNEYSMGDILSCDYINMAELFRVSKGEHLCIQGQELEYIYFQVKGKGKAYTTQSSGKTLLMTFCQGFQLIGDIELMGQMPSVCAVQALEEMYCIGINTGKYREELLSDIVFLRYVGRALGDKLMRRSHNNSLNMTYPLENRLAAYILAARVGAVFDERFTELSELLGTSYRHLLRTVQHFVKRGYLVKAKGGYIIKDLPGLSSLAADIYR